MVFMWLPSIEGSVRAYYAIEQNRLSCEVAGERWPIVYCSGDGGNKNFVFEDRDLVVVITASAYSQRYMHTQVDEMMSEFILPAVRE